MKHYYVLTILILLAGLLVGLAVMNAAAMTAWTMDEMDEMDETDKMEKVDKDKITTHNDEWKQKYDAFEVDESMAEAVSAKVTPELKIVVYFAFWCGDSENNVPPFMKIIEKLEDITGNEIRVVYYEVQRKASKDVKYYVEEFKVERVPTFIFYKGDNEIGRIIENPKQSLLEDFLEIVFN